MKGVSVIIPTFNREQLVGKAIESVLDQQFDGPLELLISDDGSTDNTIKIASSYGDRVKILIKPATCTTQGASGARNRALRVASQPYICFLDSDDFFLPLHISRMVGAMEAAPKAGFAFCRVLEMDESKSDTLFRQWTKNTITPKDISNIAISKYNVVHTNGFIFRKEVFEAAGTFDEGYKNGEDIDLWMRINELYKGVFSDHYGAVLRRHGMNHLTDNSKAAIVDCHYKVFKAAITRYFKLGLQDPYRLGKLFFLVAKYKLGGQKLFHTLYPYYYNLKNKRKKESNDWFSLSHFFPAR